MKNAPTILIFLFSFCFQMTAQISDQKLHCNTPPEKSEWLTKFQQNPEAYEKTDEILYIPITAHLVGSDEGEYYFPMYQLLDELCSLNETFAPTDIQFFLEGEVHYINSSEWYLNSTVAVMNANNVANTVNCYFTGHQNGSFYSPAGNAVVLSKRTLLTSTIWEHELGHFFSLPHTFLGWELSNYYNYSSPAPTTVGGHSVERVDGTNCIDAADGFCDTPPDYLWLFDNWFCFPDSTSSILQTDPTGATFRTDGTLIMAYSNCANRFSEMQIQAMRANIVEVRSNLLYNQNPQEEVNNTPTALVNPGQGVMVSSDNPLQLEWKTVANATHYLVQLTFLPYFSRVYDEYIVADTSLIINNLSPDKNYRWRVRPYNAFHTCAPFSADGEFSTGVANDCDQALVIGTTTFGHQTNASVCKRISQDANGNIMATWTQSFETSGSYPDRGSGYNRFDAAFGNWQNIPTERLEPSTRTGWPNHVVTDNGTELIVNHVFTNQGISLHTLRRTAGSTNWVESQMPTNTPRGHFSARMAVSGETIHVIAVTTPVSFGGTLYQGVDAHLLYYRSSNGGATWDVVDRVIPGTDNSYTKGFFFLDCYAIDARDDVVAIGIFSAINDVRIIKSEDGGDTWTNTLVHDFPLSLYEIDQGYNINDLPPTTPQQPNPLAILTTDNSGSVLIDKNGMVHAFYGQMYFQDNTINDGYTFYLETDGIAYWNESFGADSSRTIAKALDLNGNGLIDVEPAINLGSYPLSMTSTPSPAVDEGNNLYLAFSMVMEGPEYRRNEEGQQYRHLMIIHSQDGAATWSAPFDLIEATCTNDQDITLYTEAMYPSMLRDIDNEIMLLYQQDFDPGNISTDRDPPTTNFMRFSRLDVNELGVVKTEEVVDPERFDLNLYPNPATDLVTLSFELKKTAQVQLSLYNVMGQQVLSSPASDLITGENQLQFEVGNLSIGIYFVQLRIEDELAVVRLVVQ